ncbi:MAG: universal stress protein [Actinobacteria bacterium]|nr:universal stress protein [Actinomycetota bacterium]
MFKKILVPIELSELDDKVMQFVSGLSRYGVKEAVLMHVAGLKGVERPVAMRQEKKYLEEVGKRSSIIEKFGLKVKPLLAPGGTPHEEILHAADEEKVSLIVTGTRGKGAFNELAVGSISEMVGRRAMVPVVMVPYRVLEEASDAEAFEMGEHILDRVLYPTDFSDVAERTLELIKSLNNDKIGEIIVAHVIEPKELRPEHKDAVIRSTKRILAAIKEELVASGVNARAELVIGAVVAETLQMADEMNATCFIVGSHGRGIGESIFIGSVSQNIIRMSKKPVIITH